MVLLRLPVPCAQTTEYQWCEGEGPVFHDSTGSGLLVRCASAEVTVLSDGAVKVRVLGWVVHEDGTRDGRRHFVVNAGTSAEDVILQAWRGTQC